jgi:uncharacterized protein (TIGR02284 family)
MSDTALDAVRRLHTRLVDAREGYEEGIDLAERATIAEILRELRDLHAHHAAALEQALAAAGAPLEGEGSLMAQVHKAVLHIRAALTGLDEAVIPALRDGEARILDAYDEAAATLAPGEPLHRLVATQRAALADRVAALEALEPR